MAKMPPGQPRNVPDPEGDLYDLEMARIRRLRETSDFGAGPLQDLIDADPDILDSLPKIRQPGPAASLIPVVGPAWQAAADLQEGNLVGAGVNTALASQPGFRTFPAHRPRRADTCFRRGRWMQQASH